MIRLGECNKYKPLPSYTLIHSPTHSHTHPRILYDINTCLLCWMFILIHILCSTIEYYCINMVLYKSINTYIYLLLALRSQKLLKICFSNFAQMFLRVVSLWTRNVNLIDPLFKAWERILVYLGQPGLTASLEANHDYCVCPLPCTEGQLAWLESTAANWYFIN